MEDVQQENLQFSIYNLFSNWIASVSAPFFWMDETFRFSSKAEYRDRRWEKTKC